jgi:hypothetical protein
MNNVLYHGSNHKIDKFSDEFAGRIGAPDAEGPGIYLTNSKENAAMWGSIIYTVTLSPRNVITNLKPAVKANKSKLKELLDLQGEDYTLLRVDDVEKDKWLAINDAIKYSDTEDEVFHSIRQEQYVGVPRRFMRDMTKIGYDALKLYKEGFQFDDVDEVYHYVVYNPDVIEIIKKEDVSNLQEVKKIVREIIKKEVCKIIDSE